MLLKKTTKLHQKDFSRNYYGRPDYEEVKDSIEIGGNLRWVLSDGGDFG